MTLSEINNSVSEQNDIYIDGIITSCQYITNCMHCILLLLLVTIADRHFDEVGVGVGGWGGGGGRWSCIFNLHT